MKGKHVRHGDVMLTRVDPESIDGLCERFVTASPSNELTIALGEATGHHHTLYPVEPESQIKLVEINGRRFIDLGAEYFLRHQEHSEHRIAPGCYEITMEDEYDPFAEEMKKVVD